MRKKGRISLPLNPEEREYLRREVASEQYRRFMAARRHRLLKISTGSFRPGFSTPMKGVAKPNRTNT